MNARSSLIIIAISIFINFQAYTQTASAKRSLPLTSASPGSTRMSEERVQKIDAMLREAVDQQEVPGAVALIVRNGKIIFHEAYGLADSEKETLMDKNHIFRIASQTKAITSTAVMMLWEEGKFRLDDPISKFIPEFKTPKVITGFNFSDTTFNSRPAEKEITIRHLLTHTSGIGYGVIDGDERMQLLYRKEGTTDLFTSEDISIASSVKKIAKMPLAFDPGTQYKYSLGLDVLGYFIEVVSGKPFDQFLKERIFEPLGMKDTGFYLPEEKSDRLVAIQQQVDGEWKNYPNTFYDVNYPVKGAKRFFSGGAGLSSTVKDYAAFLQLYLNGGEYNGKRLLSKTTIATIMADQTGDLYGGEDQYHGLAFGVNAIGEEAKGGSGSEGTFYWGGYFNTQYFADPKEKIIGLIFKQTRGPSNDNTSWKFKQMVMSAVDD
ncbi:serine hydrolase domain-containing protein [Pleomorphovibrio marinus]|uniref:serine hydrolase domain-containing protein n=1 Tax=Pleomorphovibrio marinus TaxID=2164132 RepID=UPI000E0AB13A|nr:serine hydrolase domain-containing protein [Pleomorphovibrio marinus]